MKFSEYVEQMNKLLDENPEYKDFDVVCSTDDEGNFYRKVYFGPTVGSFDGRYDFIASYDESEDNAICVN